MEFNEFPSPYLKLTGVSGGGYTKCQAVINFDSSITYFRVLEWYSFAKYECYCAKDIHVQDDYRLTTNIYRNVQENAFKLTFYFPLDKFDAILNLQNCSLPK